MYRVYKDTYTHIHVRTHSPLRPHTFARMTRVVHVCIYIKIVRYFCFIRFPFSFRLFYFIFFLKVIYNEYFSPYFFALYLLPSLSSILHLRVSKFLFRAVHFDIIAAVRLSPFRCKSTPPVTVAFLLSLIFSFLRARDSTFFTNRSIFYGVGTGCSQLFAFSKARNASVSRGIFLESNVIAVLYKN